MGEANLLYEPVAALTYEAWMVQLIVSLRPVEQAARRERMKLRMQEMGTWGAEEIERRLDLLPVLPEEAELQGLWNRMFMIDLFPENAARFDLDMAAARRMLMSARESGR